ncbi:MAG: cupin domain-containing protein [Oceanicaulis sp.]
MTDDITRPQVLGEAYVHLLDGGGAMPVAVDARFWSEGVSQLPPGRLVSLFDNAADWTVWEMHPEGEEVIFALEGAFTFHFERGEERWSQTLSGGAFLIVPRGVWHTVDVATPGRCLFITAGEGTQHREREATGAQ